MHVLLASSVTTAVVTHIARSASAKTYLFAAALSEPSLAKNAVRTAITAAMSEGELPETVSDYMRRMRREEEERMESERRRVALLERLRRLAKVSGAVALVLAGLSLDGPPRATLGRSFTGSLLCISPGFIDSHVAVSYGYGGSLLWQASLYLFAPGASYAVRLLATVYIMYGLKVIAFQAARDVQPAYVARVLVPQREHAGGSRRFSPARARFVLGVGVLLSGFTLPLHAAARGPSPVVVLGAVVAMGGLSLQTVADVQKQAFKASRGEIGFQAGVLVAGVSAACVARSVPLVLLAALAPCTFIRIMLEATKRLEARQLESYGSQPGYREWVRQTPRLLFAMGAEGGEVVGDETREKIAEEDAQQEINEGIVNILGVTGLAGVAAAVIGAAGAMQLMF